MGAKVAADELEGDGSGLESGGVGIGVRDGNDGVGDGVHEESGRGIFGDLFFVGEEVDELLGGVVAEEVVF